MSEPRDTEVFALFVPHSAYDGEVDAVPRPLAKDKQLGTSLGRRALLDVQK